MRPSTRIAQAVAATTCSSQWRRDARVLGSLPLRTLGSLGPSLLCATHAGSRVPLLVAVRTQSLRDASPESESSPFWFGRFLGRRPLLSWQGLTLLAMSNHWRVPFRVHDAPDPTPKTGLSSTMQMDSTLSLPPVAPNQTRKHRTIQQCCLSSSFTLSYPVMQENNLALMSHRCHRFQGTRRWCDISGPRPTARDS